MSNSGHTIFQVYRKMSNNSEIHNKWTMTMRGRGGARTGGRRNGKKDGESDLGGDKAKGLGGDSEGVQSITEKGQEAAEEAGKTYEQRVKKEWVAGGAQSAGCGGGWMPRKGRFRVGRGDGSGRRRRHQRLRRQNTGKSTRKEQNIRGLRRQERSGVRARPEAKGATPGTPEWPMWAGVWRRPARPPSAGQHLSFHKLSTSFSETERHEGLLPRRSHSLRRLRSRHYHQLKRHMRFLFPSQSRPRARLPAAVPRDNKPLSRDSVAAGRLSREA